MCKRTYHRNGPIANANRKIDIIRNSSTVEVSWNSSLSVSKAGATIVEAIGAMKAYMAIRTVDVHRRCAGQLLRLIVNILPL